MIKAIEDKVFYELLSEYIDDIIEVKEETIRKAVRLLNEQL